MSLKVTKLSLKKRGELVVDTLMRTTRVVYSDSSHSYAGFPLDVHFAVRLSLSVARITRREWERESTSPMGDGRKVVVIDGSFLSNSRKVVPPFSGTSSVPLRYLHISSK